MCGNSIRIKVWLLLSMVIYKVAMDYGWCSILPVFGMSNLAYVYEYDLLKYLNGWLWCLILFLAIRHNSRSASSFFLAFIFLVQIVPLTTIYAFADEDLICYNAICASFLVCELLLYIPYKNDNRLYGIKATNVIEWCFIVGAIALLVYSFMLKGLPSSIALNPYMVYTLRSSQMGRFPWYIKGIMYIFVVGIIPYFIAKSIYCEKYCRTFVCVLFVTFLYLYTGNKLWLFVVPLMVGLCIWARRETFYYEVIISACVAFALFTAGSSFSINMFVSQGKLGTMMYRNAVVYDYLVRRPMFVPARLKFFYYDYFSRHPKTGWSEIVPRRLLPVEDDPYKEFSYCHDIARIYYNKPFMYANTGFFAEGHMRFGVYGGVIILTILAIMLKLIDSMQERTSYSFVVGAFIPSIYSLADAQLLGGFFRGSWAVLLVILLFCDPLSKCCQNNLHDTKRGRIDT